MEKIMEKTKSLLFITPCLSFAGAEKILFWVATGCARKGYKVNVLNLNLLNNNSNFEIDNNENIPIYNLPNKYKKGLNSLWRIKKIIEFSRDIKADLIIAFTFYPCVLSAAAGIISGVPVLISERGDPKQNSHGLKNKIRFLLLNKANGCVFQTKGAQIVYSKKLICRSTIIPNPVFINNNYNWEYTKTKKIISIGRIENNQKRYDVMLNAFKLFQKAHHDYSLLIYGKGPDEELIKKLCKNLELDNCVNFMGLTKESLKSLCESDIFLITSDFEGVPNALLEAMSVGMPVISTDCSPGGARFLIQNKVNGFIVQKNNAIDIANALDELCTNPTLMKKCGKNARITCEQFNPEVILNKWIVYIEQICE